MTHKLTSSLVFRFGIISIEDLHVNSLLKNHTLAKHIADASFGEIRRQLTYKAELYGNMLHIVDRFFPLSKMCSRCGVIKGKLTLTERTYVCEKCGMVNDRDLNAAMNLNTVGRAHPEPTDACGHDGSVDVSGRNTVSARNTTTSMDKQEAKVYTHDDMCVGFAEQEIDAETEYSFSFFTHHKDTFILVRT